MSSGCDSSLLRCRCITTPTLGVAWQEQPGIGRDQSIVALGDSLGELLFHRYCEPEPLCNSNGNIITGMAPPARILDTNSCCSCIHDVVMPLLHISKTHPTCPSVDVSYDQRDGERETESICRTLRLPADKSGLLESPGLWKDEI